MGDAASALPNAWHSPNKQSISVGCTESSKRHVAGYHTHRSQMTPGSAWPGTWQRVEQTLDSTGVHAAFCACRWQAVRDHAATIAIHCHADACPHMSDIVTIIAAIANESSNNYNIIVHGPA